MVQALEVVVLAAVLAANAAWIAWQVRWARNRLADDVRGRGGTLLGMRRVWTRRRTWEVTYVDARGRQQTERLSPMGSYVWRRTGPEAAPFAEAIGQTLANPRYWTKPVPLEPGRPSGASRSPLAIFGALGLAVAIGLFLMMALVFIGFPFGASGILLGILVVPLALGAVGYAAFRRLSHVPRSSSAPVPAAPVPSMHAPTGPPAGGWLPPSDATRRGRAALLGYMGFGAAFLLLVTVFLTGVAQVSPLPGYIWLLFLSVPVVAIAIALASFVRAGRFRRPAALEGPLSHPTPSPLVPGSPQVAARPTSRGLRTAGRVMAAVGGTLLGLALLAGFGLAFVFGTGSALFAITALGNLILPGAALLVVGLVLIMASR